MADKMMKDEVPGDPPEPESLYEYLDHTADVQIHSWGSSLEQAFEACAVAMFGYMTDLDTVDMTDEREISAEGHDLDSLLYSFLDEFLFLFSADPFLVCRNVEILDFDKEEFKIKAVGRGEKFNLGKHPQGTEVKAITYSNMQIHQSEERQEIFVIIDI